MCSAQRNQGKRDGWPALWPARRRRVFVFLVLVLLGSLVLVVLTAGPPWSTSQQTGISSQPAPTTSVSTVHATPTGLTPPMTFARSRQMQLYAFAPTNPGLMQPAVDGHGHLWVGEMFANRLARLDASTGQVSTWETPEGKNGIMTTAIDTRERVWFVEQNASYLGRFDPAAQRFQTFPLRSIAKAPMGPQSLQFDASGQIWFTAATSGEIGQLNQATGKLRTWPVPAPIAGAPSMPFSLAVTQTGQIWFGYLTGGTIGDLDPATGQITLFHLGTEQATIFAMTTDRKRRIWFTEQSPGRLGMIDPITKHVTLLAVPSLQNTPPALYGIAAEPSGAIWFADNSASALVRYQPDQATYTVYPLPASSAPYGLTLAPGSRIWFTSSGSAGSLTFS